MATNKWLLISEDHNDLNRCIPCRGNLTNTPHASHTQSAYGPRLYVSHMVNALQPFAKSSTTMDRATATEKKGSRHNPQYVGWPIHGSVPNFSPKTAIEAVGVKPPSVDGRLIGLLDPYLRHVIGMFNTCSQEPTHWSLTDIGGDTILEVPTFHIPLSNLPIRRSSTFHLKAPPGLRLCNLNKGSSEMLWNTYHRPMTFRPLGGY
jgi:hypothetical protein